MPYNNLLFGMKRRILDEIRDGFNRHPAFSKKVEIYNKFPYEERLQYGVVLRNASGSQIRLSADNYLGDSVSHVRLARESNYVGLGIEWVRENTNYITLYTEEDVSSQVGPTQRMFTTSKPITMGPNKTEYADNVGQIELTVNGTKEFAEFVYGEKGIVLMNRAPAAGSTVTVGYFYRVIDVPGIYVVDYSADNQFIVTPIYIIDKELLIENTTGLEAGINLAHGGVDANTDTVYLQSKNGGPPIDLIRNTDYTINYSTGAISFLNPLPVGRILYADYRYQTGNARGPYTFRPYQEIHEAIPGAVMCIGRRAQKDDRQIVILSKNREPQAKIYGGHWTMSLSLAVVSKDTLQMEEMADHLVNELWIRKKNRLEYEGITLETVEPTGETEETYIDTTGDLYYESSVDVTVMTEWQEFVPYFFSIKRILVNAEPLDITKFNYYDVSSDGVLTEKDIQPDLRHVIKYASTGYERVT